jgi:hypothetical protein
MIYKVNTYAVITKNDGVTQIVVSPSFLSTVEGAISIQYQKDTELMTGISEPNTAVVTFIKPKVNEQENLRLFLNEISLWRMCKLELFQSITGGNTYTKVFDGLLFERTTSLNTVTYAARGYLDLLNITLIETPLLRNRRVATYIPAGTTDADKFTKLKAQNPTILEGSSVGIINAILWLAGGRPYKYKSLFDTQYSGVAGQRPKFYYDCEASVINPEWVWFNYENLYSDLTLLCKASGGMLSQDLDGTIQYRNIFGTKQDWNGYVLNDSKFSKLDTNQYGTEPYSKIITTYTPRYISNSQEVFKTVINEYLNADESVERQIQFTKPVYKLVNKTISGQLTDTIVGSGFKYVKDKMNVVDSFGTKQIISARIEPHNTIYITKYVAADTIGNFTKVKDTAVVPSQSTTLYIKNTQNQASTVYVGEVSLFGRALESANQATYMLPLNQYPTISGFKELRLNDNPYIQSESQAVRLINIAKYLMEIPRPALSVSDIPYTSSLKLGDTILVNSAFYSISGEYKITSVAFNSNLTTVQLSLLSMSGLFSSSETFQVGASYQDANSRILTF